MLRLTFPRVLLIIAALGTAIVLQSSIFARLGLPGSTPDLLLVAVLVIALVAGPLVGAVTGFAGGLLADIAPPAAGSLGQTAAIYALGWIRHWSRAIRTWARRVAVSSVGERGCSCGRVTAGDSWDLARAAGSHVVDRSAAGRYPIRVQRGVVADHDSVRRTALSRRR